MAAFTGCTDPTTSLHARRPLTHHDVLTSPPDNEPDWMTADSSVSSDGSYTKGIAVVMFQESATQDQRQAALDSVSGVVVGGLPLSTGDGYFYVQVPDSGSGVQLQAAIDRLSAMPQVEDASLDYRVGEPTYLKPNDGTGWQHSDWNLTRATPTGSRWSMEAINAPFAWGCATGDTSVKIAVIDHGFDASEISSNTIAGNGLLGGQPSDTVRHGTEVSNVLAARGNDGAGMTGVMWRAGLQLLTFSGSGITAAKLVNRPGFPGDSVI